MATDATGTPTAKGIPKYNTAADAPSGLGFNAAMDSIDSLLDSYVSKPSGIATGEVPVWNGSAWARSSVTRVTTVRPQDLTQDAATTGQVLTWNGTIWAPGTAAGAGYGTALPGSPTDGQEYILVDSTSAATYQWRFRYNNSRASNKWEFVGGTPIIAQDNDQSTRSSASYGDLADTADSPSITVPKAGEYLLRFGCQFDNVAFADVTGYMSYSNGATAATDAVGVISKPKIQEEGGVDRLAPVAASRTSQITVASASDQLVMEYRTSNGNQITVSRRWMTLTPIRVS